VISESSRLKCSSHRSLDYLFYDELSVGSVMFPNNRPVERSMGGFSVTLGPPVFVILTHFISEVSCEH
jgi:hypothetical protein